MAVNPVPLLLAAVLAFAASAARCQPPASTAPRPSPNAAAAKSGEKTAPDAVRSATLRYYMATALGDPSEYHKVTRLPLILLRDGALSRRDEKETRALLATIAARNAEKRLTSEDKRRIVGNMIAAIDDASLEFTGASTAVVTFVIRPGAKESDGDSMCTLVLSQDSGVWKVVLEVTDSKPVPSSYLKSGS